MRAAALLAVSFALAVAGCGSESSTDVLRQTADNLGKIRSGDLTLRVTATTKGGKDVGFELAGPFALAKPGGLPVAKITLSRLTGSQPQPPVTVISTGEKGYIVVGSKTFELPASRLGPLRSAGGGGERGGSLENLDIGGWMKGPSLSNGGKVAGAETDRVRADLDVVRAANDLLALAGALGRGASSRIEGKDAAALRRAVRSGTIEVFTGKDDRLLRRLLVRVDLRANAPAKIRSALGALGEVDFRLDLSVANPNEPVHVQAPANAEPLPSG